MTDQETYDQKLNEEIAKLQKYNEALEQEFASLDPEDAATHKLVRKHVHELVPDACTTIAMILQHGESESVRSNVAKWVLDNAMKSAHAEKPRDVIAELFTKLADNDDVE